MEIDVLAPADFGLSQALAGPARINQISTTGALLSLQQTTAPGRQMRYTVQYQNPTGHWVVYDNQSFTMLGSFRTEDDARVAARRFEERAPTRRIKMASPRVA